MEFKVQHCATFLPHIAVRGKLLDAMADEEWKHIYYDITVI